jgi:hypothetical protein
MEKANRITLFGGEQGKLDIIYAVNAVNFILSWLTDSRLTRRSRIEIAALAETENGKQPFLDIDAIAQDTCLEKPTVQILMRTQFLKRGWAEKKEDGYYFTSKGVRHAKSTEKSVRTCAVERFSEIPKAYQLDVYNALRLIGIGMTGSKEMRDLSDLVIMVKCLEYMVELKLFTRTYYAGQACLIKSVADAGRMTCSAYCSDMVPYKTRQSVKFLMLRMLEKGYLAYVGSLDKGAISIHGDLVVTAQGKRFLSEISERAEYEYEHTEDLPYDEESVQLIKTGFEALAKLGEAGIKQRWYELANY